MDRTQRIDALRMQIAEIESEMAATARDLPEDPALAPEVVARYRLLDARYQEFRDELARLEKS